MLNIFFFLVIASIIVFAVMVFEAVFKQVEASFNPPKKTHRR